MKTKIILLCFILVSFFCKSQTQSFQWVEQNGGIGEEYAFSIAVDDSSNSYITGYMDAANNIRLNNSACINHDIFIAKYDKTGTLIWIDQIGGGSNDIGWGISVDKDHNVYVAASFQDTLNLATDTLICQGFSDVLVTKFNSAGVLQWARKAGGSIGNYGYAIDCDSLNNVYVTGSFYGTVQFDAITLTSYGWNDCFLAKYDTYGNLQWAINSGGSTAGIDEAYAISIDKDNNIYTSGKFSDTAFFASDTLISKGGSDCFISKFDPSGNMQWVKQAGGNGDDIAQGIALDNSGNICVTGYFESTGHFESDSLISNGGSDIFIAKYDSSGNLKWSEKAGGSGTDQGAGISSDKNGKNYITGFFSGNSNFGSIPVVSSGSVDIFVTCLDSLGNFEWTKKSGSIGLDAGSSIGTDTANNIFLAGLFTNSCTFESINLTSEGSMDLFIGMIDTDGSVNINENITAENNLNVFPNPTNGIINFVLKNNVFSKPVSVNVFNNLGVLVFEKQFKDQENKIDLSSFGKGIYFIETVFNETKYFSKVIVN